MRGRKRIIPPESEFEPGVDDLPGEVEGREILKELEASLNMFTSPETMTLALDFRFSFRDESSAGGAGFFDLSPLESD